MPKNQLAFALSALLFVGAGCEPVPSGTAYYATIPQFGEDDKVFLSCNFDEAVKMAQGHVITTIQSSDCAP